MDAVKIVSQGINQYKNKDNSLLIITHSAKILESLKVDYVHVLVDGKIVKTGGSELVGEIGRNGFQKIAAAAV